MTDFTDEPTDAIYVPTPIYLGVLGSHPDATQQRVLESILFPLAQELGRLPDKLNIPEEGISSIFIHDWAMTHRIPAQVYQCTWQRHGKRARIFRDARIQDESTHFLVFLQKRSTSNQTLAERLARKGHRVFTVSYEDWSMTELVSEKDPPLTDHLGIGSTQPLHQRSPPSSQPSARAEHGRTRDIGREPASHQSQPSIDLGSQRRLTDLWVT